MRIEFILPLLVVGISMWAVGASVLADSTTRDLDVVRRRLFDSLTDVSPTQHANLTSSADRWLETLKADGSWPDQDYADKSSERWKCVSHLPRLVDLATAGRLKGVPAEKQVSYISAALSALRFWLDTDPTNNNWWHNEIGVPLQIGHTLILLGSDAPVDLRQRGVELMKRSKWEQWTGQNLVWGTRIQIIRACVSDDFSAAEVAFKRMYDEIRINPGRTEGVKPDWSFYQHGELLYSGGYGSGFTSDTARLALLARETAFAIPPDKLEIIVSHLLDGQAWMTRGHYWDYSVTGREIVRKGKIARSLATPARDLAQIYPQRKAELLALAGRLTDSSDAAPLSGNRHFWYSDYMVHHRTNWFASARMYSNRTKNTDPLINGESRRSHFLAEGASYIMLTGGEYEDIFPVWDWHKIPGATIEQGTLFEPKKVSHLGVERFVGGVSDGAHGCATMDLSIGQLRAKKSWFFFDEGFVALGAGITCDSDNPIVTTINQCLLDGDLMTSVHADQPEAGAWLWHARVGYVPLQPMTMRLDKGKQQGSWHEISSGTSTDPVERDVFLAYIEHGPRPTDSTYSYLVLPATTAEQTADLAKKPPVTILSNTVALQAVRHESVGITQAIFRQPGTVDCGGIRVTVDKPCALLVKQQGGQLSLSAANPLNEPMDLVLLTNSSIEAEGATMQTDGQTRIRLALPGGTDAGKSLTLTARVK